VYRLADYLDQYGRSHRADQMPPIDFWTAIADHAHPADLTTLGRAAWDRGLYRDAAQLDKHATINGNLDSARALVLHLHTLHPGDCRPAQWAAVHVALDNPYSMARLLDGLRLAGAGEQATVLLARDPAAHVDLDNAASVAALLKSLREAGASEQTTALAERAAAHVDLDDPHEVAWLLMGLREAGAGEQSNALVARGPAAHVDLDHPSYVGMLLRSRCSIDHGGRQFDWDDTVE
jgi:hypothetical protein